MSVNFCRDVPMICSRVPTVKNAAVFIMSTIFPIVIDPRIGFWRDRINGQNKFLGLNTLHNFEIGEHSAKMFRARDFAYNAIRRAWHADH